MTTDTLVKKLNKEVKTLRRDVATVKALLVRSIAIPEEGISEYKNAAAIRRSLKRANR